MSFSSEVQPFFLNKCFPDCDSFWLIYRVLRNVIWTIFSSFLVAFMQERILGEAFSTIFTNIAYFFKLYWVTDMLIHVCLISDCFCAPVVGLKSWDWDPNACKVTFAYPFFTSQPILQHILYVIIYINPLIF